MFTLHSYLHSLKVTIAAILFSAAAVLNPAHQIQQPLQLGADIAAVADFRTSLASGISSSATSMTLVTFTSGSDSLVIGTQYGFKLGGQEYVLGTASTNNQIINLTRGLSRSNGTSTVTAYQTAWGRGTSVEITDAPLLLDISNKVRGVAGFDHLIHYAANFTVASDTDLVPKKYVDDTAFSGAGVINASQTARGVVELATQIEVSSSTSNGSSGVLAIAASSATSTHNTATAGRVVVVTQPNGFIDSNFINSSSFPTLAGSNTFTSTNNFTGTSSVSIGAFPAYQIGKNIYFQNSAGDYNFTMPSGVSVVHFILVGARGGNQGLCSGGGSCTIAFGGGGGGSGACYGDIATSSNQILHIHLVADGANGTFGSATNGGTGVTAANAWIGGVCTIMGGTGGAGGTGGTAAASSTYAATVFPMNGNGGGQNTGSQGDSALGINLGTGSAVIFEW